MQLWKMHKEITIGEKKTTFSLHNFGSVGSIESTTAGLF